MVCCCSLRRSTGAGPAEGAGAGARADDEAYEEVDVDPLGYIKANVLDTMISRAPSTEERTVLEAKRKAEYNKMKLAKLAKRNGGDGDGDGDGARRFVPSDAAGGAVDDVYHPPIADDGENNSYAWTPKGGIGGPDPQQAGPIAGRAKGKAKIGSGPGGGGGGGAPSESNAPVGKAQRLAYQNQTAITKQEQRHWTITLLRCGNFAVCQKLETKEGEFSLCSACQIVPYCSGDCQTAHWQKHKVMCKELKEEAQANHSYENVNLMKQIRSKYSDTYSAAGADTGKGGASDRAKYVNNLFSVNGFAVPFASEDPGTATPTATVAKKSKEAKRARFTNKLKGAKQGGSWAEAGGLTLDQSSHTFGRRESKLHEGSNL